MEWEEMGYIFYLKKIYTKVIMKLITKGGFSSKLRIECLAEPGHEARTHRPSPSSSNYDVPKHIIYTSHMRGDKS